jgi:protein-L-isoaspartate(D-aspartate) O-methyltransferase
MIKPGLAAAVLLGLGACGFLTSACSAADGDDTAAREKMVRTVERQVALLGDRRPIGAPVMHAMREVPRHRFVPAALRGQAYEDRALPIGEGQTISQPFIVAYMTALLEPDADDVVLEVGTGSAYQAAILSRLVRHVYTIEIVKPLAEQAAQRLSELGYGNVTVRHGDGYAGWPEHAPFDAIMVTAGADHVPQPLIEQLKPEGRLVMPVGNSPDDRRLLLVTKDRQGRIHEKYLIPVAFVPMTGKAQQ